MYIYINAYDRSESINKMKFSENLLRRSRMSNQTPVEHCKNGLPIRYIYTNIYICTNLYVCVYEHIYV